jgi:hypothetical protein
MVGLLAPAVAADTPTPRAATVADAVKAAASFMVGKILTELDSCPRVTTGPDADPVGPGPPGRLSPVLAEVNE